MKQKLQEENMFTCEKCSKQEKDENRGIEDDGTIVCFECFDKKTVERIKRNCKKI